MPDCLSLLSQKRQQCSEHSLDSLPGMLNSTLGGPSSEQPSSFSVEQLRSLYDQFYSLAAHFHFIAKDWDEGWVCLPERKEQITRETRR